MDYYFKVPIINRFVTKYDILHVEDNELERNVMVYYFKKKNLAIKSVENAESALYEFKSSILRIILIDILLFGKIQGDTLCKTLKDKEENKKVLLINFLEESNSLIDFIESFLSGITNFNTILTLFNRLI